MAFDAELDKNVTDLVVGWGNTEKKRMFGGICHLLNGNMFAGVLGNDLIVRVGEEEGRRALGVSGVRAFNVTGRPMKGWVVVEPSAHRSEEGLGTWLEKARRFAETLPPKEKAGARR